VLAAVFFGWYTWKRYRGEITKKTDGSEKTPSKEKEGGIS
jgi:hypothetical protein